MWWETSPLNAVYEDLGNIWSNIRESNYNLGVAVGNGNFGENCSAQTSSFPGVVDSTAPGTGRNILIYPPDQQLSGFVHLYPRLGSWEGSCSTLLSKGQDSSKRWCWNPSGHWCSVTSMSMLRSLAVVQLRISQLLWQLWVCHKQHWLPYNQVAFTSGRLQIC